MGKDVEDNPDAAKMPDHTSSSKPTDGTSPSRSDSKADRVAKAEATISQMAQDYPNWALEDVAKLEDYLRAAVPMQGNGKTAMPEAFKIVHDMRGQGGSFGYPLITRISGSFCRFLESVEGVTPQVIAICNAHAKAMRTVLDNRVKGSGGEIGNKIASGLEGATAKYLENQ